MLILIKKNYIALVLAFCMGAITAAPQMFAIYNADSLWNGIYPTNNDDEHYYLTRVQEVYDGYPTIAQPYLSEGKEGQPLQFWLPDVVAAKIGIFLEVSPPQLFIIMDFVFPVIIFLILYWIGFLLLRDRGVANIFALSISSVAFLSYFSRPISPQLTIIPFLVFLGSFFSLIQDQRTRWLVLASLSFGALFHAYTYYWTHAVVFLCIVGFAFLVRKNIPLCKRVGIIFVAGLFIGVPYLVQIFSSHALGSYSDTVQRLGMLETHFPSGILVVFLNLVALILLCCGYFFKLISISPISTSLLAFVLSSPVVMNHHVITGMNLEFSSHYRVMGVISATLCIFYVLHEVCKKYKYFKLVKFFVAGCMVSVALYSGYIFWNTHISIDDDEIHLQQYGEVIRWIQNQTDHRAHTYFAHQELSAIIPAYTSANVYYAREANLHFMTNEEVETRYVVSKYFEDEVTHEDVLKDERAIFGTWYLNNYGHTQQQNQLRKLLGLEIKYAERYPDTQSVLSHWEKNKTMNFTDLINNANVTHIIWDKENDPEWEDEIMKLDLSLVFSTEKILIYSFSNVR